MSQLFRSARPLREDAARCTLMQRLLSGDPKRSRVVNVQPASHAWRADAALEQDDF